MADGYKKSTSWGDIPDSDELWDLMDGDPFRMELQGADSLAWDYAMTLSPNVEAGSLSPGKGMEASLEALVDVRKPEDLSDEDYEDVEDILDAWHQRYEGHDITDTAWSLASSIMEVLGVEWI